MDTLKKIITESKNIVFFGGAGVSTESGIPDFRGEKGIYLTRTKYGYSPEEIISRTFFDRHPDIFYDYYKNNFIYKDAEPNKAHLALAGLEKQGRLKGIVTQNVDGLHQIAGNENVYELHGSVHRNYCMKCRTFYNLEEILQQEGIPLCSKCGGIVKPDIILYEEGLDSKVMEESISLISQADVLIIGGTSLVVYPAAAFVDYYRGNKLVLINKEKTPYDQKADCLIHDSIGKVLAEV